MDRLSLSAMLSHLLVAFTIEFDNEAERQMRHRTTRRGLSDHEPTPDSLHAPWLVSLVMWSNCMRFLSDKGVTVRQLADLARTSTNINGMERWGYVVIEPDPADKRPKPPRSQWLIRPTAAGRKAQEVWRPLFDGIEKRWQERFGNDEIGKLRESLQHILSQIGLDLPDCLPILGYGLFSRLPDRKPQSAGRSAGGRTRFPLSALLSQVLLTFALEFERQSDLSLAISANVLRVLDEKGVQIRDLPLLTAVSKEAISMAMGFLQKRGIATVENYQAASRTKLARLTPKGYEAMDTCQQLFSSIEAEWQVRLGKDAVRNLRPSLEPLVGDATSASSSPLFRGLEPYPDGWRASIPKPNILPHYPMVLHRGGFPDGS
jgi:DNA-binding MarR family transcriptional regulator